MRKARKIAMVLASMALGVSLIGVGVNASFTSAATATDKIQVGQFGVQISSTTPGAVLSGNTITLNGATIQSSAAGSQPLEFTITNTGTMPALLHVASSDGMVAPFSDMLSPVPGDVTIPVGGHQDYNGGIQWGALGNAQLGQAVSITYTVTASQ